MTRIFNEPEGFVADALRGFAALYPDHVRRVDGGVVRAQSNAAGHVSVVVGGGSGHYPAFAGLVGPGLATGAVCGQVFTSPSSAQAHRVARECDTGGGVLFLFGNYAGDVIHFGRAERRLRAEGIDTRTVLVTDDIASAPPAEGDKRRGIAGDFVVFKVAGAAADAGLDLDEVTRLAQRANARTRSLGVGLDGCTLPGSSDRLFHVPVGQMSIGLGIHGEPGIVDMPLPRSAQLADIMVERLLADLPDDVPGHHGARAVVIVNGLGSVKYEELFVLYADVADRLEAAGVVIVQPECGELVTSLDMAGVSVTLVWLDEELERWWRAPADTPAYSKAMRAVTTAPPERTRLSLVEAADTSPRVVQSSERDHALAQHVPDLLAVALTAVQEHEYELGRVDAIAGDGDHGTGMRRGVTAALSAASVVVKQHGPASQALVEAGQAWAEHGGGTSGALWGFALEEAGRCLLDQESIDASALARAVDAALAGVVGLGKAEVGDKTMVDAFVPFAASLRTSIDDGRDVGAAWFEAALSASVAAKATASLTPRRGRARPLAEKSVGHPDAGALSFAVIVTAIGQSLTKGDPT